MRIEQVGRLRSLVQSTTLIKVGGQMSVVGST